MLAVLRGDGLGQRLQFGQVHVTPQVGRGQLVQFLLVQRRDALQADVVQAERRLGRRGRARQALAGWRLGRCRLCKTERGDQRGHKMG
jgi:hypothetical protein